MLRCTILVAVGANLPGPQGTPLQSCVWAVARLQDLAGLSLRATSRWYRSPAWPASEQPGYVNGAVRLSGEVDPHALLRLLHAIEAEGGRVRSVPHAARTLDLDLLAIDGLVIQSPDLTVPHPRLHERAFVLAPLAEIAPGWRHPGTGRTVQTMLSTVGMADVCLL